jgi:hypothetical protein
VHPESRPNTPSEALSQPVPANAAGWEPPRFAVISLDCEITSYAPDDQPLF